MKHLFSLCALLAALPAAAHFQIVHLPDGAMDENATEAPVTLIFGHPSEGGETMDMGKGLDGKPQPPVEFGVMHRGEKVDLLEYLEPLQFGPDGGRQAYRVDFEFRGMGDYVYYCDPGYYWEPAEDVFIRHYTKTIVNRVGASTDWNKPVGFPAEIMPLVKPYALWAGNVFRGRVMKMVDGQQVPAPNALIEVEYLNNDVGTSDWENGPKVEFSNGAFITQQIRTDENGEFIYGLPRAGWWGFAALLDGDEQVEGPDGEKKDVELGALLWVWCEAME